VACRLQDTGKDVQVITHVAMAMDSDARVFAEAVQGLERPDVILPDLTGLIPILERGKGYALRRRSRARTGTS
jgi:hypothetical protein